MEEYKKAEAEWAAIQGERKLAKEKRDDKK